MPFEVTCAEKSGYLHAIVTGTNSPESVVGYMNLIRAECRRLDCYRVLIEENLEGPRFDEMEIFALITDNSVGSLGYFEALAYVDLQQDFEVVKFAETVAVNRGIPIAVFSSVADAENWIRHRRDDQSGQDIFTGGSDAD